MYTYEEHKQLSNQRMREATDAQLAKAARQEQPAFLNTVLARLGRQMVMVGERLQTQPEPPLHIYTTQEIARLTNERA